MQALGQFVRRGFLILSTMTLGLIGIFVGGGPALAQTVPDPAGAGGAPPLPLPAPAHVPVTSTGTSALSVVLIALAAAAFAAVLALLASSYQHNRHAPTPA